MKNLLLVVLLVAVVVGWWLGMPGLIGNMGVGGQVGRYPGKIVYGVGGGLQEVEWLMRVDCGLRLGRYSHCGSSCASDAEYCVEVCAYTCELF
jgi:hypothetical protein